MVGEGVHPIGTILEIVGQGNHSTKDNPTYECIPWYPENGGYVCRKAEELSDRWIGDGTSINPKNLKPIPVCICDNRDLMICGCRCGHLKAVRKHENISKAI